MTWNPKVIVVGLDGSDTSLHAATIAIVGEVTLETLWHAVPPFPSVSEVWLRLLEEVRRDDPADRSDRAAATS